MKVTFGVHLDTGVWPHPLLGRDALAGEAVVGPEHFLTLLETHLGLSHRPIPEVLRVSEFRRLLQASDSIQQFYHESFALDPWGVATELLAWYDGLLESGWNGSPLGTGRLRTLTSLPCPRLPGVPERMSRVTRELPERPSFIGELILADPLSTFSPAWQRLLARLRLRLGRLADSVPPGQSVTDLQHVQRGSGSLRGDGSLIHLRAASPWEAGEVLAAWLAGSPPLLERSVVVAEARGDMLDSALRRFALPCQGSTRGSPWRPATQVLPLLLSLAWRPLDPQRLLEYLTLPKTPLPWGRVDLAQALREAPGIGGPVWQQAWTRAIERATEPAERTDHEARLAKWLGGLLPLAAYSRDAGLPIDTVISVAGQVAQWAIASLARGDDPALQAARTQALALRSIAQDWDEPAIRASHLDRILAELAVMGTVTEVYPSEAGRLCKVAAPGAVIGPVDTVIWWNFVALERRYRVNPWTPAERQALQGLTLPDARTLLRTEAAAWRRPLEWSSHRVVLVSWDRQGHTAVERHPLYDELQAGFDIDRTCTVTAASALAQNSLLGRLALERLDDRVEPRPRSVWSLPTGRVSARKIESSSSIETLFECPLRWTLQYAAAIRPRVLGGLADDELLFGQLGHAVVEHVVGLSPLPTPEVAYLEARVEFDRLLPLQGAALLLPGRATERAVVRESLARAARVLVGYLQASPYRVVGVEMAQTRRVGRWDGFTGAVDVMLADDVTGRRAVLDLKWSRSRYRKKLAAGTAVQLALYAGLMETDTAAYFALRDAAMLVPSGSSLAGRPIVGPTLAETLGMTVTTFDSHMRELTEGRVSVNGHLNIKVDGVEDGRLRLTPPCNLCDHRLFCAVSND